MSRGRCVRWCEWSSVPGRLSLRELNFFPRYIPQVSHLPEWSDGQGRLRSVAATVAVLFEEVAVLQSYLSEKGNIIRIFISLFLARFLWESALAEVRREVYSTLPRSPIFRQ